MHNFVHILQSIFSSVIKILLYVILLFLYNCENKISAPERIVNQPGIVEAYGYNNSITVEFYGNNIEEGFEGYNIYISKISGINSQKIEPVNNPYGSKPTLLYGFAGCFPDASQKSYITLTEGSSGGPLDNNTNYYVAVSAYLLIGNNTYESSLTEEVQARIRKKTNVTLSNQKLGNLNDGIIFNNNSGFSNIDVPDILTNGSTGDIFFKFQDINGTYLPVLSTEYNQYNDNYIQDVGYVEDMDEFHNIPESGYIRNGYLVAIEKYLYILHIPAENKYIRIHVEQIGDSYIKLLVMYSY